MRYITYILLTAFVSLLMASCELEASSHGNLYGFWHLETIETIESGSTKDMRDELKFWSVQSKLIELSDHDGVHNSVLYHFQREGDSLFLFDPHFNLPATTAHRPPHQWRTHGEWRWTETEIHKILNTKHLLSQP